MLSKSMLSDLKFIAGNRNEPVLSSITLGEMTDPIKIVLNSSAPR